MSGQELKIKASLEDELVGAIKATADAYREELRKMNQANKDAERVQKDTTKASQQFGDTLNDVVTGAVRQVGALLVNSLVAGLHQVSDAFKDAAEHAVDFKLGVAQVNTLLTGEDVNLQEIEQTALRFAAVYGSTAQSQIKGFYEAFSAGAKSAEEATQLMHTANKLAVGGVTDVETSIVGLVATLNAYELGFDQAEQVAQRFFVTMDRGIDTTIPKLSHNLGQVAPTAHLVGLSLDELFASVAAITKSIPNTEMAVVGLNQALVNLVNPKKEAVELANKLGLEFSAAAVRSKGWLAFLRDVADKTKLNENALTTLFGNIRGQRALFSLLKSDSKELAEALHEMKTNTEAANIAFEKITGTTAFKWERLKGSIDATRIALTSMVTESEATKGVLDGLNDALEIMLNEIFDMSLASVKGREEIQKLTREGFGKAIETIGTFIKTNAELGLGIVRTTVGIVKFGQTFSTIMHILQPSLFIMDGLKQKFADLFEAVGETEEDPAIVALFENLRQTGESFEVIGSEIQEGLSGADREALEAAKSVQQLREELEKLRIEENKNRNKDLNLPEDEKRNKRAEDLAKAKKDLQELATGWQLAMEEASDGSFLFDRISAALSGDSLEEVKATIKQILTVSKNELEVTQAKAELTAQRVKFANEDVQEQIKGMIESANAAIERGAAEGKKLREEREEFIKSFEETGGQAVAEFVDQLIEGGHEFGEVIQKAFGDLVRQLLKQAIARTAGAIIGAVVAAATGGDPGTGAKVGAGLGETAGSFAEGGYIGKSGRGLSIVKGGIPGVDSVNVRVQQGEAIIDPNTTANLRAGRTVLGAPRALRQSQHQTPGGVLQVFAVNRTELQRMVRDVIGSEYRLMIQTGEFRFEG